MTEAYSESFNELGLNPTVTEAVTKLGYEQPTPIQKQSIPIILSGKDLVGQAQTGTGKTAAFALPLISKTKAGNNSPQILVLTPTRELAIQVSEAFHSYAKDIKNFRSVSIYGGQSIGTQFKQLRRGADVIVGTPGRVMDHLRQKTLNLSEIKSVVLDEADEMLKMGFIEDIEWILQKTPKKKQVALFSATMPDAIKRIAKTYLVAPEEIKIKTKTATVEKIKQYYWIAQGVNKLDALSRYLEAEEIEASIVFVRTKTTSVDVAEKLEQRGISCAALNGDLNQSLRERTIEKLKDGSISVIIATDVAARGIDVERVSHVINYDIPFDSEAYIHRIGRTGRAGRQGTALLFVAPRELRILKSIEKATKQQMEELHLPSTKILGQKRIEAFKEKVVQLKNFKKIAFYQEVIDEIKAEHNMTDAELAPMLCFLAQRDRPFIIKEDAPPKEERTRLRRKAERGGGRRRRSEGKREGRAGRPRQRSQKRRRR